jgi:hypothetical protein
MTSHHAARLSLSPEQAQRLGSGLTIQLRHEHLHNGTHEVHLNAEQTTRLARAHRLGTGVRLQLTAHQLRTGGGFLDHLKRAGRFIKSLVVGLPNPRDTIPPSVRSFLQKHGQQRVIRMSIGRLAIGAVITRILNLLSLGKFSEVKKKLGYEQVWHTFLLLTLSDGQHVVLERNHVVELHTATSKQLSTELLKIPLYAHPSLSELLSRAEKKQSGFWLYSHDSNNCQALVHAVLQSSPEVDKQTMHDADSFYKQNAAALAGALGVVGNEVSHRLTELAARGDRLLHGDGLRRRKRQNV